MQRHRQTPPRRQDPISCSLCRKKKLRCNRQHPCSNCVARNVPCEREGQLPVATSTQQQQSNGEANEVMERLQRLEELVLRMGQQLPGPTTVGASAAKALQATPASITDDCETPNEIAHKADTRRLVDIGTRDNSLLAGLSDGLEIAILSMRDMSGRSAALHTTSFTANDSNAGNRPRQIQLPLKDEALLLFELYIQHVSYLHHIIHVPSARAVIHEVYSDPSLGQPNQSVSLGKVAFVLSMLASTISFQMAVNVDDLTPIPISQARLISMQLIRSTFDVLEHSRRTGFGTLEAVQAMITIFFLTYKLDGFSPRARIGFMDALSVARDIGLHRTDYEPDRGQVQGMTEVELETRRRVWWHMTASDWVVSLSGGPTEGTYNVSPAHFAVHKPRNINDSQLSTAPPSYSLPLSTPTDSSYLIQRIKLATICRQVVDAMPLQPSNPDALPYSQFVELDQQFDTLFNELPYFFKVDPESRHMARDIHYRCPHIAVQKYMINMTANTRRCKLHQPFLVRGFANPPYRHSRDVCLQSARLVLQMERELAGERLFGSALVKLSGINHHVFFAAITLVMDLCFNRSDGAAAAGGMTEEERKKEVWEACNMLKVARDDKLSPMADKFLASLVEVLRKHRVRVEGLDAQAEPMRDLHARGDGADHLTLSAPEQTWQLPSTPDFDEVWQGYIDQGPNFEITDWEELFNELEPQFNP